MAYASRLDLEHVYSEELVTRLADQDNDGVLDQEDEQAIEDALEGAASIIDANLGVRYNVPLSDPPPIVRDLSVDIGLYRLAYNRLKQTDEMRLRYEDAIKLLQRVADGKASIGIDTTGEGSSDDTIKGKFTVRTSWLQRA